jgi:hypothetical protein
MKHLFLLLFAAVTLSHGTSMEFGGTITSDMIWNVDTVKVIGTILVENGATLRIMPGTRVEAQNAYGIGIKGALQAIGTSQDSIIFTCRDKDVGWSGL